MRGRPDKDDTLPPAQPKSILTNIALGFVAFITWPFRKFWALLRAAGRYISNLLPASSMKPEKTGGQDSTQEDEKDRMLKLEKGSAPPKSLQNTAAVNEMLATQETQDRLEDASTEKKFADVQNKLVSPPKTKTICITGMNAPDGMGDVVHMLNVGSSLEKSFPQYNIVYHIAWTHSTIESLKNLVGFLKKYKIIPSNIEIIATSFDEYLTAVNSIDPNKFTVFMNGPLEYYEQQTQFKEKMSNVNYFVAVSMPPHFHHDDTIPLQRAVFYNDKRILFLTEHGGGNPVCSDLVFRMGFSEQKSSANQPPVSDVGILLQDNTEVSKAEQLVALRKIKNEKFKKLLFGKSMLPTNLDSIIDGTLFIPTYFVRGEEGSLKRILAAIEKCLPEDKRNVFLQGRFFNREQFLNETIKKQLIALGFEKIEYLDDTSDKVIIIDLNNGTKGRTLKVFNKIYLDDDDYDLLNKKLSTTFIGCSGDNSFQDAISRGAIPIFFPHDNRKWQFLEGLKNLLKKKTIEEKGLKWEAAIMFLESYSAGTEPVFTPELQSQWKEVCIYLIREHNTHDKLKEIVKALMELPELEKSTIVSAYKDVLSPPYNLTILPKKQINKFCELVNKIEKKEEIIQFFDIIICRKNFNEYLEHPGLKMHLPILFKKFNQHLDDNQKKLLLEKVGDNYEDLRNILSFSSSANPNHYSKPM